ncbi:MAG TPA: protein phosphatase 2C domain-containing protein [Gemmatimonadales bacterium]|nr:protein phosphatase 2C domain-containing protein [Gemmatimonadales bacterium]
MAAPDTSAFAALPQGLPQRRPRDDEIDVYGLTHPGRVRTENQDHFLICSLRKEIVVHGTSLAETGFLQSESERLAFLAMVADGVGGAVKGAEASRATLETVAQYVSRSMRCYYASEYAGVRGFSEALHDAAVECHADLLRRGEEQPDYRGMATTLTLFLGVWPRAYLLQVGDSRCYLLRDDELIQITRDQTVAQELVDLGVMKPDHAASTRLAHTLSSSIGGRQSSPVVSQLELNWGTVLLLCSDGLTNHVSDERIRDRLRSMKSASQACKDLLQEALEGGGSDNITIIVARAFPRDT